MTKKDRSRYPLTSGVDFLSKHIMFILFLGVLSLVYISNVQRSNRMIRQIADQQSEIIKTRNIYLATKCDLIKSSQQSEVAQKLATKGFKDSYREPVKILARR